MTTYEINPGKNLLHFDTDQLKPGDVVRLLPGEHDLRPWAKQFHAHGTAENPITITGHPGAYITREGVGGWQYGLWILGNHYRVHDLDIRGCAQSGVHFGGKHNGRRVVPEGLLVERCTFTRCGAGVWIEGNKFIVVDNEFRDGVMTVNTPGGDDDYGASAVVVKGSDGVIARNRGVRLLAPSHDYRFDGSGVEIFVEALPVHNVVIEDNDFYVCNTLLEVGGWRDSTQTLKGVTVRNNRIYNPVGGRIADGVTWDNFQMYTIHEGGGFGVRFANETGTLTLENNTAWNTTKAYHYPRTEKVSIVNYEQKSGELTAADFFALRQQLPLPEPTPEPEPEPTPEPPTPPTPEVRYVIPAGGKIKLLFGEQVIELPFEIVEAS